VSDWRKECICDVRLVGEDELKEMELLVSIRYLFGVEASPEEEDDGDNVNQEGSEVKVKILTELLLIRLV
jgi:hypothetical protein